MDERLVAASPWNTPITAPGVPAPLPAGDDLRTELTRHLMSRAVDRLERREQDREWLLADGYWRKMGEEVRGHVRAAFGPMPFGDAGAPVDARPVSWHETRHCGIVAMSGVSGGGHITHKGRQQHERESSESTEA